MRDPRLARAQERRDRRTRRLAGRRITLALFADAFARLIGAELAAALALILLDIGGRPARRVVADIGVAVRNPKRFVLGLARVVLGLILAFLALGAVATLVPPRTAAFSWIASAVFIGGLGVDALVGDRLRAGIGLRR